LGILPAATDFWVFKNESAVIAPLGRAFNRQTRAIKTKERTCKLLPMSKHSGHYAGYVLYV
jgi:hypothetical protein